MSFPPLSLPCLHRSRTSCSLSLSLPPYLSLSPPLPPLTSVPSPSPSLPPSPSQVEDINGDRPIHLAAKNGHTDVVLLLFQSGANINSKGMYGNTALIKASYWNQFEVCKGLLQFCAADIEQHNDGEACGWCGCVRCLWWCCGAVLVLVLCLK